MNIGVPTRETTLPVELRYMSNSGVKNGKGSHSYFRENKGGALDESQGSRGKNGNQKISNYANGTPLGGSSSHTFPNSGSGLSSGSAGSGSSNASKNLSHVPCKFYKQGICQAGNTCPFSHNLDGTLAADKLPCKYFQKGNCKFGLKCALAHFLPDGTKVKYKGSFGQLNGNNHRVLSGSLNTGHDKQLDLSSQLQSMELLESSSSVVESMTPKMMSENSSRSFSGNSNGTFSKPMSLSLEYTRTSPFSLKSLHHLGNVSNGGQYSSTQPNFLGSSAAGTGRSYFNNTTPTAYTSSSFQSSFLGSNSVMGKSPDRIEFRSDGQPSSRTSFSNYFSPTNDSAVVDEDEEENYDESSGFFEDCLPGSLSDIILTPQEIQRRDSRSQSGTLLVRPSFHSSFYPGERLEKESIENFNSTEYEKSESLWNTERSLAHDDVFIME